MVRSVIVTGGFGTLGTAVAEAFCSAGDRVARIDFAESPKNELKGAISIGGVDLTSASATKTALERVAAMHGGIEVLVNVAGGFIWEEVESGAIENWSRMHLMNLMTAVTTSKLALPYLLARNGGRIVNIGAAGAVKAVAGMGAYAASKSSVHRFTEALAEELSDKGVTVNAILPSIIDTPVNRAEMPDADFSEWVQPRAIAEVITFLASPEAGAVNGTLIPVTRGV